MRPPRKTRLKDRVCAPYRWDTSGDALSNLRLNGRASKIQNRLDSSVPDNAGDKSTRMADEPVSPMFDAR